jgi:hypothetical protein
MLHAQYSGKPFGMDVLEDVFVIDFSGGWFFPAGVVADLEICSFVPGRIDIGNNIADLDLGVINIVEDFAGWTVYRLAN